MDVVKEEGADGAGDTDAYANADTDAYANADTDADTVEVDELIAKIASTATTKLVDRARDAETARADADHAQTAGLHSEGAWEPASWQKELCTIATTTLAELNGEDTKRKLTAKQEAKLKLAKV